MPSTYEVEIKLRVDSPRILKRRIKKLGFVKMGAKHFEDNFLFDFEDGRLGKAHALLRLRNEGRRHLLTYKGAPLQSESYKVRREIETGVDNGARLRGILEMLGLRVVFRYQKYRTIYSQKSSRPPVQHRLLVFDETPIGHYLELEGPGSWIDKVAGQLGYGHQDYITVSYATLYREHCRQKGLQPRNLIFGGGKS